MGKSERKKVFTQREREREIDREREREREQHGKKRKRKQGKDKRVESLVQEKQYKHELAKLQYLLSLEKQRSSKLFFLMD